MEKFWFCLWIFNACLSLYNSYVYFVLLGRWKRKYLYYGVGWMVFAMFIITGLRTRGWPV